jgi:hypothetical protein
MSKAELPLTFHNTLDLVLQIQELSYHDDAHNLVYDHKLALLEAELNWLARTIVHLEAQKMTNA